MLYLKLVNHDRMFQSLRYTPIIANDFDTSTKEGRDKLSRLLYTRYEGDTLSVIPTCDCGNLHGGINLGKRCHICVLCRVSHVPPAEKQRLRNAPALVQRNMDESLKAAL